MSRSGALQRFCHIEANMSSVRVWPRQCEGLRSNWGRWRWEPRRQIRWASSAAKSKLVPSIPVLGQSQRRSRPHAVSVRSLPPIYARRVRPFGCSTMSLEPGRDLVDVSPENTPSLNRARPRDRPGAAAIHLVMNAQWRSEARPRYEERLLHGPKMGPPWTNTS